MDVGDGCCCWGWLMVDVEMMVDVLRPEAGSVTESRCGR